MDEYRKRLEENADEAEFALMIDDYLNDLGDSLQKKYEEAKRRGETPEMPEDMKNRLRQFIANYNEPIETTSESAENTFEIVPNNQIAQRSRKWLRRLGVAAATIAILVGSLFTAQAAGIDVFGTIARWTDSVFVYERSAASTETDPQEESSVEKLKHVILAQGLPQSYAPSWLPERFILSELKAESNESFRTIQAIFTSPTNEYIIIEISDTKVNDTVWNEKTDGEVETLEVGKIGGSAFRVFQNSGNWSAIWCNGSESIAINSDIELEELKEIITTMGEY